MTFARSRIRSATIAVLSGGALLPFLGASPPGGAAIPTGRVLDPPGGALVAPGIPPDLAIVCSGDVLGFLEPCG